MVLNDAATKERLMSPFGTVFIINLEHRKDRRVQMNAELAKIGEAIDGDHIRLFKASSFQEKGNFPSIGARGCFHSHLEVLRTAKAQGLARVTIFEDDIEFMPGASARLKEVSAALRERPCSIFYGGVDLDAHTMEVIELASQDSAKGSALKAVQPSTPVITAHFITFDGNALELIIPYFEAMLRRAPGHSNGGPMHVDGAYSWFRKEHPELVTLAVAPKLAKQRSSRSDIAPLRWFDRYPIIKNFSELARNLKR